MRVERIRVALRKTAKKRAPWARFIYKVPNQALFICYEDLQQGLELHGPLSRIDFVGKSHPFNQGIERFK